MYNEEMETDIMICRSNSPEDRRLSKGLLQRSVLFREKGIKIFDMATMAAGLHMVHEATEAALSSRIIILLASIDFLTDPFIEWLAPLILSRHQQDESDVFILSILLRDCLYSHSPFARIPLVHSKPMRLQSSGVQERIGKMYANKYSRY